MKKKKCHINKRYYYKGCKHAKPFISQKEWEKDNVWMPLALFSSFHDVKPQKGVKCKDPEKCLEKAFKKVMSNYRREIKRVRGKTNPYMIKPDELVALEPRQSVTTAQTKTRIGKVTTNNT